MAKKIVVGWQCPYSGTPFLDMSVSDELFGYGNPPRSPGCPVGVGRGALMTPVAVEIDTDRRTRRVVGPFPFKTIISNESTD